jgi:hypothetical protein
LGVEGPGIPQAARNTPVLTKLPSHVITEVVRQTGRMEVRMAKSVGTLSGQGDLTDGPQH